jgi:hypothetical protein
MEAIAAWNRVAAAVALIAAIELHLDSPKWTHEDELSDDGYHTYCNGREDVRAMIADWQAAT